MAAPAPTSTGEKQTIQARHGVATFVPKGHTIKIINTYGKQVVDTWAFALHAPPEDTDIDKGGEAEEAKEKAGKESKSKEKEPASKKEKAPAPKKESEDAGAKAQDAAAQAATSAKGAAAKVTEKGEEVAGEIGDKSQDTAEKVTEKVGAGEKKGWSSYIPTVRGRGKAPATEETKAEEKAVDGKDKATGQGEEAETAKSWSSYLPSVRAKPGSADNTNSQSKGWSSYIPSGVGYSSYIPAKGTLSAFASTHNRDPTKSYAEQLYDFSKTPVGAAGLSVATGSGYAGSLYAGYKAYSAVMGDGTSPGMEFLSMTHSRASTGHLVPRVDDTLVSNLRAPLLTIIEDTSPGIHDTLIAACDPQRYKELGVEKWEEHGSCAENLVMALKLLNEASGLKGDKAIGSDVTVNSVPAPLNLFMNIPWTQEGDITFEAPKGKRGDYVKMRAERDVVVVMSACPQDILEINNKKPMVAHFVVENPSPEDQKAAQEKEDEAKKVIEKAQQRAKGTPRKLSQKPKSESEDKSEAAPETPKKQTAPSSTAEDTATPLQNSAKSGRKAPKKLEKRSSVSSSPAPSAKG